MLIMLLVPLLLSLSLLVLLLFPLRFLLFLGLPFFVLVECRLLVTCASSLSSVAIVLGEEDEEGVEGKCAGEDIVDDVIVAFIFSRLLSLMYCRPQALHNTLCGSQRYIY